MRINNFQRRDITVFNFDVDLRWHRYSSNICHNTGAYENLPLLSMRFVYALDRPTRYTARSFRSTAPRRQFKGVTKGELVENSFQFAQELIRFQEHASPPWISDSPRSPSDSHRATAISVTSTYRVRNKIIKSWLHFETRPTFGIDIGNCGICIRFANTVERNPADVRPFATNFYPLSRRMHFATSVYLAAPSF